MKILVISKSCPTFGGVERWVDDLLPGLQARGHEVVLALTKGFRFHFPDRYLSSHPSMASCRVVELDGVSGVSSGRVAALRHVIASEAPDVVLPVMVHESLTAAVAQRRECGQRFALIYPVHEDGVWAFRAVAEFAGELDGVICVNRLMQQYIREHTAIASGRVHHVRCGVDAATKTHRFQGGNGSVLTLGFAGKLVTRQKRVLDLLGFIDRAQALGMQIRLRIAGEGDQTDRLRSAFAERGLSGQVEFLGKLTKEQLYQDFYPSLDALLIFSDWETGPIVAWEAMMHGVLVVSSEYRGMRMEGILRDGKNAITFPVGSPEVGAERMQSRLTDLPALAEQGMRVAEQELAVGHMIDETDRVLIETSPGIPIRSGKAMGLTNLSERFEDGWRRALRKPIYHGNPHLEWPWFGGGAAGEAEITAFAEALDKFEKGNI